MGSASLNVSDWAQGRTECKLSPSIIAHRTCSTYRFMSSLPPMIEKISFNEPRQKTREFLRHNPELLIQHESSVKYG